MMIANFACQETSFFFFFYEENLWLCNDFIKNKVRPSHYSIRSASHGSRNHNLKNWCFEGSNDQNTWKKLDSPSNEESLSENRASNLFEIKNQSDGDYFRYLRIRQIGLNDSNNNNINVFGSIQIL